VNASKLISTYYWLSPFLDAFRVRAIVAFNAIGRWSFGLSPAGTIEKQSMDIKAAHARVLLFIVEALARGFPFPLRSGVTTAHRKT
jgi:hypothetical protein